MSQKKLARAKAPKVPFSFKRHILPPLAGVLTMLGVLVLLNGELIWARLHYQFSHPSEAIVTIIPANKPANSTPKSKPNAPSEIIIPGIHVHAPVIFDEPSLVEWKVQLGLRRGTVHYGSTALPGQNGTVVIIGHSSGQPWAPGNYKWVFTLLDKVKIGDQIQLNYQGIPYIYEVTDSVVVAPTDTSVLKQTNTPTLSLITCTPVGTSKNRLVVHAKQISPVPAQTQASTPAPKPVTKKITLPGSDHNTSLWQVIKSWF